MNYELATELKNAGFPQSWVDTGQACMWVNYDDDEELLIPSLSQLIAACGERFGGLVQAIGRIYWRAYDAEIQTRDGNGSTPEQAVARLWLALNKK